MTKILRNHIIHEFAGICYENPDLYHERHDKRSRWASRYVLLLDPCLKCIKVSELLVLFVGEELREGMQNYSFFAYVVDSKRCS